MSGCARPFRSGTGPGAAEDAEAMPEVAAIAKELSELLLSHLA